jgi:dihydroxy-acid dehydratase
MQHRGQAVVFENVEDYRARIDDPNLEVTADSVLVMKNSGPKGYPGMPEVGNMSIPKKLLEQGITDLVRISDGRMSGTGFGTVVLHVAPEAAVGGTLAVVQNGDWIRLDVPAKTLSLEVDATEIAARKKALTLPEPTVHRGYVWLYRQHVGQADTGADFDFLKGSSGSKVSRDSH